MTWEFNPVALGASFAEINHYVREPHISRDTQGRYVAVFDNRIMEPPLMYSVVHKTGKYRDLAVRVVVAVEVHTPPLFKVVLRATATDRSGPVLLGGKDEIVREVWRKQGEQPSVHLLRVERNSIANEVFGLLLTSATSR